MVGLSNRQNNEALLEIYIFETSQLIDQLEQSILSNEKTCCYSPLAINEIFRIMHTIKGASAMMQLNNIAALAHCIEDLFYFLREKKPQDIDYSVLSDYVLEGVDFVKVELVKIRNGDCSDGDASGIIRTINEFLSFLKQGDIPSGIADSTVQAANSKQQQYNIEQIESTNAVQKNSFKAVIYFEDGCEMENIRAYTVVNSLMDITEEVFYTPEDILENDDCIQAIREKGFTLLFKADASYGKMQEFFDRTALLKGFELVQLDSDHEFDRFNTTEKAVLEGAPEKTPQMGLKDREKKGRGGTEGQNSAQASIISVNVGKLDKLMDLVGELVIAEAMVTQNPDLKGLALDNFQKASRQLRKITGELQDMVMSIRMVPLAATFHKTHRIVRDMSKKLNKEVCLEIIGEDTEVDKNIIEHISDPLMHLIRNAIDHGIETREERQRKGKAEPARITLEAKNAGGDVLVLVKDNGRGLNKAKILERAKQNGLLHKPESEMMDKEIYNLIFLPGFSTKDSVTEFSGRGVGMDVVTKNIQSVGGSVSVDSSEGAGTTVTLKIPLTLAIIDGMNIRVGNSRYTIPTISIKESFRPKRSDIVTDPDGNEMIMVRGQCYSMVRLHKLYKVKTDITDIFEGILIMVESEAKTFCVFADELIGEQQVVVKALPNYIKSIGRIEGLAGCTLLGDGNISLILDVPGLLHS